MTAAPTCGSGLAPSEIPARGKPSAARRPIGWRADGRAGRRRRWGRRRPGSGQALHAAGRSGARPWPRRSDPRGAAVFRCGGKTPYGAPQGYEGRIPLMTQDATTIETVLGALRFDANGLVPAIAQQHDTGEVLMLAWMNRDSVAETLT